jgi:hypothetical protein
MEKESIYEEIIKKCIEEFESRPSGTKFLIHERVEKYVITNMVSGDESHYDEVEISIFRDRERLFTTNYLSANPEYRPLAFERMLKMLIKSGLLNHPATKKCGIS